jgi:filamentous hemagglutinin
MDVRLFAFLARQPSAQLQPRERFCGLPKRSLALLLANVMFWQPLWAQADGIAVSAAGTSVGKAGNGVPVINIAKPNANGLSHNHFSDYNVGKNGLILNNATGRTQATQLGGIIVGNPNLGGRSAAVIVNEVNGANPSQLRGYTEVAGRSAHVIVANPHGITCDGCGFINTPRATLTTGKPVIDNGQLSRYQVDGGSIAIEGAGLDASRVDQFELITRSTRINAELHAKRLDIVAGRNDVQADTLHATARADDGSARPELAIDSSALGGMYAGAIRLVGTEQGVGVKLAGNVAASASDLTIAADGKVSLAQASSTGNLAVSGQQVELTGKTYAGGSASVHSGAQVQIKQSLAARERVDVRAGQLRNDGVIEAGVEADNSRNTHGDVSLTSQGLVNAGQVIASRDLEVTVSGAVDNRGGALKGNQQRLSADKLDNRAGQVLAEQDLQVTSRTLDNRNAGALHSKGSATVSARESLDNQGGRVVGVQQLTVDSAALGNSAKGLVASEGNLNLTVGALDNQGGTLSAKQQKITATTLANQAGTVVGASLEINAQQLDNQAGSIVASGGQAKVTAHQRLDNSGGTLQAKTHLQVTGGELINHGGAMLGASTTLAGQRLDNSQAGRVVADAGALAVDAGTKLDNRQGRLQSTIGSAQIGAAEVDNRGGVVVGQQVRVSAAAGTLDNRAGQLLGTRLVLAGQTLDNRAGGQVLAGSDGLSITSNHVRNQQGKLLAGGALAQLLLGQGRLDNQQGTLTAGVVELTAGDADNSGGTLASLDGNLQLTVQRLINQGGLIEASQALQMAGLRVDNSAGGRLIARQGAESHVLLQEQLDNRGGRIASASTDFIVSAPQLLNQGGSLEHVANGKLQLRADSLSGAQGTINGLGSGTWTLGTVDGVGTWHLNGNLDISGLQSIALGAGERIASAGNLRLAGGGLDSAGELLSDGTLTLDMGGDLLNQGLISSQQGLRIAGNDLTQAGGRIASGGPMLLELAGALRNQGRLTSNQTLQVNAARIDNQGTLGAQGKVTLHASGAIENQQDSLLFAGGDLQLRSASLLNRYADLYSKGNLSYAALDGSKAEQLSNLSGSIESEGDIDLKVKQLENAKADFVVGEAIANRRIDINCTDCSGDHHTGFYIVTTTYKGQVTRDSPAARLLANRDLLIDTVTVDNRQSLLAANRNLSVNAQNFYNRGQTLDNRIEEVSYWLHGVSQSAYRVAEAATNQWNAQNRDLPADQQAALPSAVTQYPISSTTSYVLPGTDTAHSGTVQAGGSLALNVSGELVNGTLNPHNNAQLTGQALDSAAIGAGGVQITLGTQAGDPGPLQDVKRIETPAADGSTKVSFVPVDFSGAPFISVDPTALPSFRLPEGDYGLFVRNRDPSSSYLIETNRELTDPGRFMASDYLLGQLGYDADRAWRRLGDGQYETRLIADAVRAQTGQRFLADGLTSDYEQFQYLMDNAVASKDALGLTLGVGLSGEQVAALTHDIVWMETREVAGEKVLAPVLYLAKVDSRNLRGGALIQGRDLNLLTGGDLKNVGTLRASNDLTAVAGGSLYQGGLAQANENLALMAQDSIRNALAGEIRGNQVSLVSLKGDILNDRTATEVAMGAGSATRVDAGSLISAKSGLSLDAATDITNKGRLSSGGDLAATAGGNINLLAVQDRSVSREALRRGLRTEETVTQLGSSLDAAGNVSLKAGGDVNVVASQAAAGKNLDVAAQGTINIVSGQDLYSLESNAKHGKKKVHEIAEQSRQVASRLSAGDNLALEAGNDVNLLASQLRAGEDAYVYAGNDLNLLAAQEHDYSLYDMKSKGSFGAKKTQRDEVTHVSNVGTQITSGADLTLISGADQLYQRARLDSGNDLTLISGGAIAFEGVKDLHQESHEKSNSSAVWQSSKGKGATDETLQQSQLTAKGEMLVEAVAGLNIDVREVNQQTVSQTIEAMVQADPDMAWLKDMQQRGDVDWRQVKEVHDSFKYSHSGLGGAATIVIAIVVAYFTAGAASGLVASGASAAGATTATAAGGAWAAGTGATLTGVGWANAAVTAGLTGMASTGAISTVNNRGNLALVVKDVTSSDALRGYAVSGVTAGLTQGLFDGWMGTETGPPGAIQNGGNVLTSSNLTRLESMGRFAGNQLLQNGTSTVLDRALGGDSSLSDALRSSLANTFAAAGFGLIGDVTLPEQLDWKDGSLGKIALHAVMGGLAAEAAGGDFKTGALAAGVNEALVDSLASAYGAMDSDTKKSLLVMNSQVIGVLATAAQGGDEQDMQTGAWVAGNATQHNYLGHKDVRELEEKARNCDATQSCAELEAEAKARSEANHQKLLKCGETGTCAAIRAEIDMGSKAIDALESQLPEGAASKILRGYTFIGGDNLSDWTLAGQLHLDYIAQLYQSNDPRWMSEASKYTEQTGFSPFGLNPLALGGMGKGLASAGSVGKAGSVEPGSVSPGSTPAKWDNAVSRAEGDFGALNQPSKTGQTPAFFNPQRSASEALNNGRIHIDDLRKLVPPGTPDGFKPSVTITDGSKFNYVIGGQKVEVKWHAPDSNAAAKFPGSNSGAGWTAQIRIGGKLLGQDGKLYRKAGNQTHIPVDF